MALYQVSGVRALTTGTVTEPKRFNRNFEAENDERAAEQVRGLVRHQGLCYSELALSRIERETRVPVPL